MNGMSVTCGTQSHISIYTHGTHRRMEYREKGGRIFPVEIIQKLPKFDFDTLLTRGFA